MILKKIETLINLGDLSTLGKSIECSTEHNFDNRINGYCVFYRRDQCDKNVDTSSFNFNRRSR